MLVGFTFFPEMSTSAMDNSLIPMKKAFWALHFWNCIALLEQLYIAHVTTRTCSACFTIACGNPDTLKSMSMFSHCVNKPGGCSSTGLPVLTWFASTFSSASLSWSTRLTDTGTQLSHCSFIGALADKVRNIFDFLNTRTGLLLWQTGLLVLTLWFFGLWLGLLGVFSTFSNFWNKFFHPIAFKGDLWRRKRWRIY